MKKILKNKNKQKMMDILTIAQLASGPRSIYAYVAPLSNPPNYVHKTVRQHINHYNWYFDAFQKRQNCMCVKDNAK